ncbi:MAG: hypothetical protein ACREI3_03650 [Nitrospirales bacterium]
MIRFAWASLAMAIALTAWSVGGAQELADGVRPLRVGTMADVPGLLPAGVLLLHDPSAIEGFLTDLDDHPPNWDRVHGPDVTDHDQRLSDLNGERDQRRKGRAALEQPVAFVWEGQLSSYDPPRAGFHVALGPMVLSTRWGLVRFKPAGLPGTMVAVAPPGARRDLRRRVEWGERLAVLIVFTGRLVSEESIIYDLSHEEPRQGMVMPVVRVERVEYLLVQTTGGGQAGLPGVFRAAEAGSAGVLEGKSEVAVAGS